MIMNNVLFFQKFDNNFQAYTFLAIIILHKL